MAGLVIFVLTHPINKRQPFAAMRRLLSWQIGSRLVPGKVLFEWIDHSRFIVARGEAGLTGNVYCGLHEFSEMSYLLHVCRPEDCFVDVGANVGAYTILASAVCGAASHCFEPIPSTFSRLMANLRVNDLLGRVTPHNEGVGDCETELRFSADQDCMNHALAQGESGGLTIAVPVVRLDAVLANVAPTIMKIDVEGFEERVLRGAQSLLARGSVDSVIMELNGSGARYGVKDQDLVDFMASRGFLCYQYHPFERRLELARGASSKGNALFIRNVDRIRQRIDTAPYRQVFGVAV